MRPVLVGVAVLCLWPAVSIGGAERQSAGASPIFERFTEQARRVLYFARAAVSEYGSPQIEPEHVLLGILRDDKGAAFDLLFSRFKLDPASLSKEIESRLEPRGKFPESVEVPFSRLARQVITASVAEADGLGDREIDTEHLLLGVLSVSDSVPALILAKYGVSLERARQQLAARNP